MKDINPALLRWSKKAFEDMMEETKSEMNTEFKGLHFKATRVPDNVVLCVPFMMRDGVPSSTMIEKLGLVKPRKDGRWSWFRFAQKAWFKEYNGGKMDQGVKTTRLLAMEALLEGLPPGVSRDNIPFLSKFQRMRNGVITND